MTLLGLVAKKNMTAVSIHSCTFMSGAVPLSWAVCCQLLEIHEFQADSLQHSGVLQHAACTRTEQEC